MTTLRLGYVPLVDAAPLIVAQELGFAAEEGLRLDLVRLGAWAQARDMLGAGAIDAAHMLVPMPVAQALGLGPSLPTMDLVMFLSHGGQVIVVNRDLEKRLRGMGHDFAFADAVAAGAALHRAATGRLRIGVPFPFSTHAELVRHWLSRCGFGADAFDLVTVPPPLMADALARGEVEAICVGEPWASVAVDRGLAALLLPGTAIWAAPPEKGLVLRRDLAETRPNQTGALMRAIWRAGRWLDDADHRGTAAEIIARPGYLDLPPELVERGLTGRMTISAGGELRGSGDLVTFHRGGASFPWKSLAALFAQRIALAHGLDPRSAMDRAMAHFRTDLYRQHLRPAGAPLPGASQRLEGMLAADRTVAAERGSMILRADGFFDGFTFDPMAPVPGR
ncbi:Nitrate transport protein NrtA precursor [Paracoccus haematequi]|uniref:Nitrate transport protein NrtA n=1 Tax=Paracoccus haematequi TaxID=2491866 RepID=A0A447IQJ4_9RHOB|nr:ABC transporter substrate-binding protein [Paracoccus haematequi]VDS09815.1 Nitrate transport protein NrtA precursor [Paracoccus haematequi]